jgi:glycosyltransferase involved in cell wall biosynthesis
MVRDATTYASAGFPFKLGEYLATGKPVIASRIDDVDKYLEDRRSAVLIEPGSVEAIAEAMRYILRRPDAARAIGREGREVARNAFEKTRLGQALYEFLRAI